MSNILLQEAETMTVAQKRKLCENPQNRHIIANALKKFVFNKGLMLRAEAFGGRLNGLLTLAGIDGNTNSEGWI